MFYGGRGGGKGEHASLSARYFCLTGSYDEESIEDTRADEEEDGCLVGDDPSHVHHDPLMASVTAGTKYPSAKNIPSARRRQQTRLGVTRSPFIEPIGATRENHYQCRLLLGLSWFCPTGPAGWDGRAAAGERAHGI